MRTTLAVVATLVLTLNAAPAVARPAPDDGPAPVLVSVSDQDVYDALASAHDQTVNAARTATGRGVADPAITTILARVPIA